SYTSRRWISGISSQRVRIRSIAYRSNGQRSELSRLMLLAEREEFLLLSLNLALQRHQRVQDRLGPRRTSGHIDVDRHDAINTRKGRVIVVTPAGGSAGAEGHHPFRLAHLFVDPSQDWPLAHRHRSNNHEEVRLPRGEAR